MKELSDRIYSWLYQQQSLSTMALIVGLLLIAGHLVALLKGDALRSRLRELPRSQKIGTVILTIAFLWAMVVVTSCDLGEFDRLRWLAQFMFVGFYLGMLFWVTDYLGARAIGCLLLLAACPVLDAAFLREPTSRVALSALCYVWLTLGLFWVGMPYTMRDQIAWVTASPSRYRFASLAGIAWGLLLVILSLTAYRGS